MIYKRLGLTSNALLTFRFESKVFVPSLICFLYINEAEARPYFKQKLFGIVTVYALFYIYKLVHSQF